MPDELADITKQVACLSRSAVQRRCGELGLTSSGSGKHCRQRLVEYFYTLPREVLRPVAHAAPLRLYRRALWILDHLPWDSMSPLDS